MSVRLNLITEQAWDLRLILGNLCECAGGALPPGLTRDSLHALIDRFDEAMQQATPTQPTRPVPTRPPVASTFYALLEAGLDRQAAHALGRVGIPPDQVARMTDAELLSHRGIGSTLLAKIRGVPAVAQRQPLIVDGEVVD